MKPKTLFFFLAVALLFSCNKLEDSPAPSSIISGKKWKLISYKLNGTEIISGFKNCTVLFKNDGNLLVVNDGKNNAGSWKEFSSPPKVQMNITSTDGYVKLLSKTWEAILLNPGRIQLADNKISPQEIIKLDLVP